MTQPSNLEQWLAWQEKLNPRSIELGLTRVGAVASRLDLPNRNIPTLTVAGTNGKGSSATLASLIYREAGYRTGLYMSPHLLRYNERVSIDGRHASDADFCRAFSAIEAVRGDTPLTYFEFGTLAALWLFREAKVDVQVLEVGLGGRLDAVNLVDADGALVTSIGLDHMDWLGPDRESIAREKMGVARRGRPVICAEPNPPAAIARCAREAGAHLAQAGRDFAWRADAQGWSWAMGEVGLSGLPAPGLAGAAQYRNAAGALAAVHALDAQLPVTAAAIRAALPALSLPGRFQRVDGVILDVAHNAQAAQVLADNLAGSGGGRIRLVLGMLGDKPVEDYCAVLAPLVERAYCAGLPGPRGLPGAELARRAQAAGLDCAAHVDVAAALAAARSELRTGERMVVTGSFLTVAAALECMNPHG